TPKPMPKPTPKPTPVGTSHRVRNTVVVAVMIAATALIAIISAGIGQVEIPPAEVLGSIAHHWHLDIGPLPSHPNGESALWNVRFPRIVLGLFVGAALGAAGCLLQGVLANPLAE